MSHQSYILLSIEYVAITTQLLHGNQYFFRLVVLQKLLCDQNRTQDYGIALANKFKAFFNQPINSYFNQRSPTTYAKFSKIIKPFEY